MVLMQSFWHWAMLAITYPDQLAEHSSYYSSSLSRIWNRGSHWWTSLNDVHWCPIFLLTRSASYSFPRLCSTLMLGLWCRIISHARFSCRLWPRFNRLIGPLFLLPRVSLSSSYSPSSKFPSADASALSWTSSSWRHSLGSLAEFYESHTYSTKHSIKCTCLTKEV